MFFRCRDALHRVTPTEGSTTRMLVGFADNDRSGIALSESALATFYGRGGSCDEVAATTSLAASGERAHIRALSKPSL